MSKSVKRYICEIPIIEPDGQALTSEEKTVVLASDYDRDVQALRDENMNLQVRLTGMTFDRNCRKEERDALAAENARLREALKRIARTPGCGCDFPCRCGGEEWTKAELEGRMDIAEAALQPNPGTMEGE